VPLAIPPTVPPSPSSKIPKASNYKPAPEELERERQEAAECHATVLDAEAFAEVIRAGGVFKRSEVTIPARIAARPEPRYTKAARAGGVSGIVRLRLILAADGSVPYIEVLERLPYGLTRESIRAACGVRFQPAMKDGQAVAQQVMVMYGFQIYDRLPLGTYPPIGVRRP
jgi:TonB family protein